jgi:hypothetical protein
MRSTGFRRSVLRLAWPDERKRSTWWIATAVQRASSVQFDQRIAQEDRFRINDLRMRV